MFIIDRIIPKPDQKDNIIGKVECNSDNVTNILLGLLQSMQMDIPPINSKFSNKAISISKKGDKYILILGFFEPPIVLSWSEIKPIDEIKQVIDMISSEHLKIGWLNKIVLDNKNEYFQFALG